MLAEACVQIEQTLAKHKRVKVLKLSKNEIDDEGFQRLATVFQSNLDLEQFSIGRNKITGTSALSRRLRSPYLSRFSSRCLWLLYRRC